MKKTLLSFLLAIATAGAAHAQAGPQKPVGFVGGIGLTGGGKKLVTVRFTNGDEQDVRSGNLVHFWGGLEFAAAPNFTLQATVGYHVDSVVASNGDVQFERYPLELIGHFAVSPNLRLGGGLRHVPSAKVDPDGVVNQYIGPAEFDAHTGAVVEGEYLFSPNFGAKLRYVFEKYKPANGTPSISGNHVGLYATFHF